MHPTEHLVLDIRRSAQWHRHSCRCSSASNFKSPGRDAGARASNRLGGSVGLQAREKARGKKGGFSPGPSLACLKISDRSPLTLPSLHVALALTAGRRGAVIFQSLTIRSRRVARPYRIGAAASNAAPRFATSPQTIAWVPHPLMCKGASSSSGSADREASSGVRDPLSA